MTDFLVKKDDFRDCRVADGRPPEPGRGQALLRVETFGMTANNVTYAVFGEAMSYWDFFPTAEDGWGRLPTWGFAEVESSEAEGVEPGTRVYGYLPSSSHLLVTPVDADGSGFVDGSPHKAELPSAYHRYLASGADPFYRERHRGDPDAAAAALLHLVPDRRPARRRGPGDPRAGDRLQRLEQDLDRRRLPARPARGRRAGRPDLPREHRVRRGAGHLRPHRRLRRDRLARARTGHLRRRLRRRRGPPGGPLALRRRARPQHGGRRHPLGGDGRRRRATCRARRRASSSLPTGS